MMAGQPRGWDDLPGRVPLPREPDAAIAAKAAGPVASGPFAHCEGERAKGAF